MDSLVLCKTKRMKMCNFEVCHPRCACKLMVYQVVNKHNCYVRIGVIFY